MSLFFLILAAVQIPAGHFFMGGAGIGEHFDEAPIHRVEITKPFLMETHEVTNEEYERYDPSHSNLRGKYGFSSGDRDAVVFVSWEEAVGYCNWLSEREGKTWRLPTEAEWEYACRAGSYYDFWWGGRFRDALSKNNLPSFHEKAVFEPVSLESRDLLPNPWGLYDMHGNVEEWCLDWYGPYQEGNQTDPVGCSAGDFKVTRGGSHSTDPKYLRSSNRSAMPPSDRSYVVGFRVVQADYPETPAIQRKKDVEKGVCGKKKRWKKEDRSIFLEPIPFVQEAPPGVHKYRHNHEPAICWCPNGDLLAIWFSTDSEFGREMTILSSRFKDGKDVWSAPRQFFKVPDRNMTGCSLFYDERSDAIIHLNGYEATGWWRNLSVIMRKSTDNGASWTTAKVVMPEHMPGHQLIAGMFRCPDGTLVQACDADPGMVANSVVHLSRDNGETWTEQTGAVAGIHAGVVSLADGRLLAFGRAASMKDNNGIDRMTMSISEDLGRTWQYAPSPFPPIRGGQRLVLMRLREGPIMLVSFDNGGTPARGMFVSLSYDEGSTWTSPKTITDGIERCLDGGAWTGTFLMDGQHSEPKGYLAATQTPDGIIHLISSKNHYRFNLKWIEK